MKLVIFDLDGVLADSKEFYINNIKETLAKYGFNFSKNTISSALGDRMKNTLDNLRTIFPKVNKIAREVHLIAAEKSIELKLCPYVKPTLQKLKRKKIKTVLLTNSTRKYALNFLNKHGIKKYFNLVLGGDQFKAKKETFKLFYKKFKVKPEETLYIGDRVYDVMTAEKVGCNVIIVNNCSWDKEKLRKKKEYHKFIVKDLRSILKKI